MRVGKFFVSLFLLFLAYMLPVCITPICFRFVVGRPVLLMYSLL